MIGALHYRGYDRMPSRVSYSGYYECFPSTRGGFDSRYPLHASTFAKRNEMRE